MFREHWRRKMQTVWEAQNRVALLASGLQGVVFTMQHAPQKCEPEGELYLSLQLRWIGQAMAKYTVPEQRPSRTKDRGVFISIVQ